MFLILVEVAKLVSYSYDFVNNGFNLQFNPISYMFRSGISWVLCPYINTRILSKNYNKVCIFGKLFVLFLRKKNISAFIGGTKLKRGHRVRNVNGPGSSPAGTEPPAQQSDL